MPIISPRRLCGILACFIPVAGFAAALTSPFLPDTTGSTVITYPCEYSSSPCTPDTGDYRTQTMGGWGTECKGDNPGCFRDANFGAAFPNGLTIGCSDGDSLHFTSSGAIQSFLPCGGTSAALSSSATDPFCMENVFAGQLLAASLNVGFDDTFGDFGASDSLLRNLGFVDTSYADYTVGEFLEEANAVFGGCMSGDASFYVEGLTQINEDFVDGTQVNGHLQETPCPQPQPCTCTVLCPEDVTLYCGDDTGSGATGTPSISGDCCLAVNEDTCAVVIDWSYEDTVGEPGCEQTIVRTFYATLSATSTIVWDTSDTLATCQQTITVLDTLPPTVTIHCPNDTTLHSDADCMADSHPENTGMATADIADLCDPNPTLGDITYTDHDTTYTDGADAGCYSFIRTWSVSGSDWCGLTDMASCDQVITVVDMIPPTIHTEDMEASCQDYGDFDHDDWAALGGATASDNCDTHVTPHVTSVTFEDDDCLGAYTLHWSAMDDCGNHSTAMQTINIVDGEDPTVTISCPADTTVAKDMACMAYTDPGATGTASASYDDNCSLLDSTLTYEDHITDSIGLGCYTILRTWTAAATDHCENHASASCTQTITVVDLIPPTIHAADTMFECEPDNNFYPELTLEDWADLVEASASDNCDDSVMPELMSVEMTVDTCTNTYMLTWHAMDECGNPASHVQYVDITDEDAPVLEITCAEDLTLYSDAECHVDIPMDPPTYTVSDCDTAVAIHIGDPMSVTTPDLTNSDDDTHEGCYTTVQTWTVTATDWCGLSTTETCERTIHVMDTLAPEITGDPVINILCEDWSVFEDSLLATADDNCDSHVTLTMTQNEVSGACPASYLRSYHAVDDCGNMSTFEQLINVIDETPPVVVITCPDSITLVSNAACFVDLEPGNTGGATAEISDNCDPDPTITSIFYADGPQTPSVIEEADDDTPEGCFSFTRTWTAEGEDECENEADTSCTQHITVVDVTPPFWTSIPQSVTVNCDESYDVTLPVAEDNCDTEVNQGCSNEIAYTIDGCATCYVDTWTCSANDDCGNSTTILWSYTVVDNDAPVITLACPDDVTLYSDDDCMVDLPTDGPTYEVTDCDLNAEVTVEGPIETITSDLTDADDDNPEGCYTILQEWTVTATDCKGNSSSEMCSRTITVYDIHAPQWTSIPQSLTVSCDEGYDVTLPVAEDNCDTEVNQSCSNEIAYTIDGCATCYVDTWTCSANDDCGNSTTILWSYTVEDNDAPVITLACPDDVTLYSGAGCAVDLPMDGPTYDVTDCDLDTEVTVEGPIETVTDDLTYSDDGNHEGCYTILQEWTITATDCKGNSASEMCSRTITVYDNTAPEFNSSPSDASYSCDDTWDVALPVAEDNCDTEVTQSCTNEVVYALGEDCPYHYEDTYTCTAVDDCGNSTTISWTITVSDNTPPQCFPEDITVCCPTDVPAPEAPLATDNCDPDPVVTLMGADTTWDAECPTQGVILRHWSVMDCQGNEASCTQTINIDDDEAPQFDFTCGFTDGEVIEICCETATEQDFLSYECDITWSDNCGEGHVIADYQSTLDLDDGAASGCTATTPEAYENGETCVGFIPHALRLFALPSNDKFFGLDAPGIVNYIDGTSWTYTATFYLIDESDGSLNTDDGFDIEVLFDNGLDWDGWSNQSFPTGYKADCPILGDYHEEWMYYILDSGTMTGFGAYDGSAFELFHQPQNQFYGCQVGTAANNANENYGFSTWMIFNGTYSYYGQEMSFMGSGDLFADLDCCSGGSYHQEVTLIDCGCNTNSLEWTVIATSDGCGVIAEQPGGANAEEMEVFITGSDPDPIEDKFPISVMALAPNPTDHATQIQFISTTAVRLQMDLLQMDGTVVMNLYNGDIHPDMVYTQNLLMSQFEAGMYQVRWSTAQGSITKKVLLTN